MLNRKNAKVRAAEKAVGAAEGKLSAAVSKLWKLVDPTSEETEDVRDSLRERRVVVFVTNLEVLKAVLDGRDDQ